MDNANPNLFQFATSELSQDALLCWLLCWADPKYHGENSELHECALKLLSAFFSKQGKAFPEEVTKVEVRKQDKFIDVLCIINDDYAVVIEDKVGTKEHSEQLKKYKKDVDGRGFDTDKVILIYLQTRDQSSYKKVKNDGYSPFLRADFLDVLNTYEGKNQILLDYRNHLQAIDNRVLDYINRPIKSWKGDQWIGFFLRLQHEFGSGDWGKVPNPAGGFFGFWWSPFIDNNSKQYLQIEEGKLCFKIRVKDKAERRHLRKVWHKRILRESQKPEHDLVVTKPSSFGNGKFMTVCVFENFRVANEDGSLNCAKTVDRLQQAVGILKAATEEARSKTTEPA